MFAWSVFFIGLTFKKAWHRQNKCAYFTLLQFSHEQPDEEEDAEKDVLSEGEGSV